MIRNGASSAFSFAASAIRAAMRSAEVDAVERADVEGGPRYTSFEVSWSPAD